MGVSVAGGSGGVGGVGARDVAGVLRGLVGEPGRPRLTWYGDDGRVELSGAVLSNWVTKTTNLLVEELDAGPGTRVRLDLPSHWRTVLWALATWRTGATLALVPPGARPTVADDVVVTTDDAAASTAASTAAPADPAALVVVTLAALARRAGHPVPAGATDAAAAVMTYPDQLGWVPATDPAAVAVDAGPGATTTYRDLPDWWGAGHATSGGGADGRAPRLLLAPSATGVDRWLAAVLRTLAADGSVVLLSPGHARSLAADPAALARLAHDERATHPEVLDPAG